MPSAVLPPPPAALLAALLLLLAGSPLLARASSLPTEVLDLDDDSFEHDTQAASGQTAGVWAVLLNEHNQRKGARASAVVRQLARDEDKEVIYAEVDMSAQRSYHTAKRFGSAIDPPALVLFRDQKMYVWDKSFEYDDVADRIKEFVGGGYEFMVPLDVPGAERNVLDQEKFDKGTSFDWGNATWAWVLIIVGLCIHAWAIIQMGGISAARAAAEKWLEGKADSSRPKPGAGAGPAASNKAEGAPAGAAVAAAAGPGGRRKEA